MSLFDSAEFNARLFFPTDRATEPPDDARDVFVDAGGGVRLHTRIHVHPGSRGTVLYFHGNGEVVADYDRFAAGYAELGVDLAVTDYRGYGLSTGTPTLRDLIFDAPIVLDAVARETKAGPILVMGRSLGSMAAAELCKTPRALVRGYIFESSISSLEGLARRRGFELDAPLDEATIEFFSPVRKLARCTTRALVLHGANDTMIEPAEAQANFAALATPDKELVFVPHSGHNDLLFRPAYFEALAQLIRRAL